MHISQDPLMNKLQRVQSKQVLRRMVMKKFNNFYMATSDWLNDFGMYNSVGTAIVEEASSSMFSRGVSERSQSIG